MVINKYPEGGHVSQSKASRIESGGIGTALKLFLELVALPFPKKKLNVLL